MPIVSSVYEKMIQQQHYPGNLLCDSCFERIHVFIIFWVKNFIILRETPGMCKEL